MKKHWNSYPEFPELGKVQAKPSLAPFPFPSPIFQRKIPLQAAHSPPCQVMSTLINVTQEKLRIPWSRTRTRKENPRGRTPGCRGSSRSRFFFGGGDALRLPRSGLTPRMLRCSSRPRRTRRASPTFPVCPFQSASCQVLGKSLGSVPLATAGAGNGEGVWERHQTPHPATPARGQTQP